MTDIAAADAPAQGVPTPKGDDRMPNPRGQHFAEDASAGSRTQNLIITVIAVLAVGAIAFALGRATAPDGEKTATVATTSGASGAADPNADLLAQGISLQNAGKNAEAAAIYNQILAKDAKNKFALFNLGVIAQTNKNFDEAIAKYKASIAVDANFYQPTYNLGLAYAAKGDRTNAIAQLRKAITIEPKAAQAYYNLGTLLIQDGKTDEGTSMLNQAFALDPSLKPKS